MNMDAVVQCLQQKKDRLLAFERLTEQMLDCPAGDLDGLVRERERLIFEIGRLDEKADSLCGEDAALRAAARALGNRGDLEEALWPVYDAAMAVRTVLSRLPETDMQAAIRLRLELKNALERIKSTNRGVGAKASRFFSASAESSNSLGRA